MSSCLDECMRLFESSTDCWTDVNIVLRIALKPDVSQLYSLCLSPSNRCLCDTLFVEIKRIFLQLTYILCSVFFIVLDSEMGGGRAMVLLMEDLVVSESCHGRYSQYSRYNRFSHWC